MGFFISLNASPLLDEVLDKHAEAMGGQARWKAVNSWKMVSKTETGRTTYAFAKRPDQFKLVFEQPGEAATVKAFDGREGWVEKQGALQGMRPGEALEMAEEPEFYEELMMSRELGHRVKLVGREEFMDKEVFKVSVKKKKGDEQTYYIDAETYLINAVGEYSEDAKWDGVYFITLFEDYRMVGGLAFAHKWALKLPDRAPVWREIVSLELNPSLPDAIFQKPAPAPKTTRALIEKMKRHASQMTFNEYTFIQETIRFNKDGTIRDTTTWYEALRFPNNFRIDFGEKADGNAVIYRNDSSYLFKGHELVRSGPEENELMLMEGGIAVYSVDTVLGRMQRQGYDLDLLRQDHFRGEPMYVIGAAATDSSSKQIWIHRDKLCTVRRLDPRGERLLEAIFADFVFQDGGWIETWVEFYINGQLLQTERYKSINTRPKLKGMLFDPGRFGDWNWY